MDDLVNFGDLAYALYPVTPFRVLCALARRQGRLQHWTRSRERRIVRDNLRQAFGAELTPAEIDRLARQAFEYRQLRGLMLTLMPRFGPERVERLLPMEGLEHLEQALSAGSGCVLATSHLNSVCTFMAVEALRGKGHDVTVALPVESNPYPASRFRAALERSSPTPSFLERTGAFYAQFNVRPIVRRLAGGSAVVLVADGWHSAAFVQVEFLGRPVYFTTGAMSVARLRGTPVVPMFPIGAPPDRLRFVFEEPIVPDPRADSTADLERMISRYAGLLEHHLRGNIAAWQHWFEERALDTMASLPERSLDDRYRLQPASR